MEPPPAPPVTTSEDRLWIIVCHLSIFVGVGLLLPLIVYLVKKVDSPLVAEHAKEAPNFHISILLYWIITGLLCFIVVGVLLIPVVGIIMVVFPIIAAVKASNGEFYRYPLTLRLVS